MKIRMHCKILLILILTYFMLWLILHSYSYSVRIPITANVTVYCVPICSLVYSYITNEYN